MRTPSTQLPLTLGGTTTTNQTIENLNEIQGRLDIIADRVNALFSLQTGIAQAIVDLTNIRDTELTTLSGLTTSATAAPFDTQRNTIDALLDRIEPVATSLLSDPTAVRQALENARDIVNGSTGVIGDATFYNNFLTGGGVGGGVDPATLGGVIANLDFSDPASVLDPDNNNKADTVLDTAVGDAVNNNAIENGNDEPTIIPANLLNGSNPQVLLFDGQNDRLRITNQNELNNIATGQRTFIVTFQTLADVATRQYILDNGDNGGAVGEGFALFIEGGQLRFVAASNDGPDFNIAVRANVAANTAYTAVLSVDQTSGNVEISGRLNGAAFDVTPTATRLADSVNNNDLNNDLAIGSAIGGAPTDGGDTNATPEFEGFIGQVTVFDRTLTAAETADAEAFLRNRFNVIPTTADPGPAQAAITAARAILTASIDTLAAAQQSASDLGVQTVQEIEALRALIGTSSTTTSTTSRSSILPLALQFSNPQAFGSISGQSVLRALTA